MKKKQDDQLSNTSAHSQTVSNPPEHSQTEFIKKKSKRTNCPLHKVYSQRFFPMSFLQRPIAISTTGVRITKRSTPGYGRHSTGRSYRLQEYGTLCEQGTQYLYSCIFLFFLLPILIFRPKEGHCVLKREMGPAIDKGWPPLPIWMIFWKSSIMPLAPTSPPTFSKICCFRVFEIVSTFAFSFFFHFFIL